MNRRTLKKTAGILGLAFLLVAMPSTEIPNISDKDARNTEPYSCKINGRVYNPQPASIVVDANTGDIIGGQNIDELRYPASMTKIMTLALVFDALQDGRLKLDDKITVHVSADVQATYSESGSKWLKEGTVITVEQAILALTVASANNVSVILAEHVAGTEAEFVKLMNEKAADIGMRNTVFTNSHGLPDRNQVTTARDMAKLALYVQQQYPEFYHFFSATKAEFGPYKGRYAKRSYNELVTKYNYIDGIKTGFICDSGYNVAVSAERNGAEVIAIVFGGRTPYQRNKQAKALVDQGLAEIRTRSAVQDDDLPNINDDMEVEIASDQTETKFTPSLIP